MNPLPLSPALPVPPRWWMSRLVAALTVASAVSLPLFLACRDAHRPAAQRPATYVRIVPDRLSGVPGTTFNLLAEVATADPASAVVDWDFGDGRTASGVQVAVSFSQPGAQDVKVRLRTQDGAQASDGLPLTVFDPRPGAPFPMGQLAMPARIGDVDGDNLLTVADVHRLAKSAARTEDLGSAFWRAGDVDLDGTITPDDARLLGEAVVRGEDLPHAILPSSGPRPAIVRLISPALLDPTTLARVRIGSAIDMPLQRAYPGYGTFLVPLDVVGPPTFDPIAPQTLTITLVIDGNDAETFAFGLTNPPQPSGQEPEQLDSALLGLRDQLSGLEADFAANYTAFGLDDTESAVLSAFFRLAANQLSQASVQLQGVLTQLTPAERSTLGYLLNAGGLQDAVTALQKASANAAVSAGNGMLAGGVNGGFWLAMLACGSAVGDIAESVDRALNYACLAVGGGLVATGFFTGGITAAVGGALLGACNSLSVASTVVEWVGDLLPKPEGFLVVEFESIGSTGSAGAFNVRAFGPLSKGLLCGAPVSVAISWATTRLIGALTSKLASRLSFGVLQNFPFDVRNNTLRKDILQFVQNQIATIVGLVLDWTGLDDKINALRDKFCVYIVGQSRLEVNVAELASLDFAPASGGTLFPPAAGSSDPALFVCSPTHPPEEDIAFVATFFLCGDTIGGGGVLQCGYVDVMFCEGDNGPALDDIFELSVDGQVLLAPSTPVRQVCASLLLGYGDHVVALRGLAAPDGIGTYFINWSAGQVISGPPQSGTDLTAGLTFTWILRLSPN